MRRAAVIAGLGMLLAGAAAAQQPSGGPAGATGGRDAQPGARSFTPSIDAGRALEDRNAGRPAKREIAKRQHNPPEQVEMPRPNLSVPPPLTLGPDPIPYPDPRPRPLFNKDFPSLRFPREREGGRE